MSKPNTKAILSKLHKDFGAEIGGLGDHYVNLPRLPTGVFPLDLALGGGLPLGKMSIVFGPESSNKTNLVLSTMKQAQILYPDRNCVFIDAEQSLDASWATQLGVDMSRVVVIRPDYAEQVVDIAESFLYASDVSIVALDSIASLITQNEIDSSAEKAVVGGASNVVGKLTRKAVLALGNVRKTNEDGFSPAFVCINQIRHKIGVMFGDPETQPGGNAPKFAASCIIRAYGKNVVENKVSKTMPAFKEVSCIIRKWKFPILQVNATYKMQMLAFGGHGPGHVDDFNTLATFLRECDYLSKEGGKWVLSGQEFPTLSSIQEHFAENPDIELQYKQVIIAELMDKGMTPASAGDDTTPLEEEE
jgi:recombination protein RecA